MDKLLELLRANVLPSMPPDARRSAEADLLMVEYVFF
jgi:hypothetical protein